MLVSRAMSLASQPRRMASKIDARRSGVAVARASRMAWSVWPDTSGKPPSRLSTAFSSASSKVRPIPMTSPTDRIAVPRVRSAPANFSKFHLGILTIT